jgi:hypothetical protein
MHDMVIRKAQFSKLVAVTVAILDSSEAFIQYLIVPSRFLDYLVVVVEFDWKLIKVSHK